jgi:GH25 family lysozyme M1 (1,4-beta-N-acetylmuramidase)
MTRKLLIAALAFAGCAGQAGNDTGEADQELTKCSGGTVVHGIDVSSYQGSNINWNSVKASGRVFGFAKASEGTGFIDGSFAHNWPGMRAAGVVRGAYHFFRPGTDGTAQADTFVNEINARGGLSDGDLAPVADVEVSDGASAGTIIARLHAFLDRVQARTGRRPIIYTANFFWGGVMGNPHFDYPLWVANYGPACPYMPDAFSSWNFWQYSDNVSVPGITTGGVDGDVFNGTLDELRAFAGGSTGSKSDGFPMSRRVIANGDGRLELFARAPDDAVWHSWQKAPNDGWSGWGSLGGQTTARPVASADADGRLEAFVIVGGKLFHTFQLSGGGGWYNGWLDEGDGSLTGEAAAMLNTNGSLEVFARSTAGALVHKWQTQANGGWSGWSSLGGGLHSDPIVGRNADGRLEVFALGLDDQLWHIWQTAPHAGWSAWARLDGEQLKGTPRVGPNADGRLEVFVTGADGKLHHIAQVPGGGWSAWIPAGSFTVAGEPAISRNGDGRLEVFARGTDDQLWHLWQTAPNSGWTGGAAFGSTRLTSDPDVAPNADGRLEVFWRGSSGAIETVFQQNGAPWSSVYSLGGNLASF